jgi:ribonuclease BN (tRNA processing enzyme)
MELIVLGGSAATPNPGDASAGYLVASGETTILLDCGSGVVSKLREHRDPRSLSAVVISHLHSDHTLDLVALRYALQYIPPGPGKAIPLFLPPQGQEFLGRLGAVFASGNERPDDFWDRTLALRDYASYLESGAPLRIGGLALTFAPMQHYIPVWAIRIEEVATGRTLTFSADTGPHSPLAAFARGSDVLLCEATLLKQTPGSDPASWGHLTAREAGQIAVEAGVSRLVLTHLWRELGFERYRTDAGTTFQGPIDLAHTGLTLTI